MTDTEKTPENPAKAKAGDLKALAESADKALADFEKAEADYDKAVADPNADFEKTKAAFEKAEAALNNASNSEFKAKQDPLEAKRDRLGVMIGGGVAILTVVGMLVAGLFLLVRETRQQFIWANAPGVITRSDTTPDMSGTKSKLNRQPRYRLKIEYRYAANGREYTGSGRGGLVEISPSVSGSLSRPDPTYFDPVMRRYPVGANVTIRYDPEEPSRSVLEPGFSMVSISLTVVGLVGVAIATAVARKLSI